VDYQKLTPIKELKVAALPENVKWSELGEEKDNQGAWLGSLNYPEGSFAHKVVQEFPNWVKSRFGERVGLRYFAMPIPAVVLLAGGGVKLVCKLSQDGAAQIELVEPTSAESNMLQRSTTTANDRWDVKDTDWLGGVYSVRFKVSTPEDYELLKELTTIIFSQTFPNEKGNAKYGIIRKDEDDSPDVEVDEDVELELTQKPIPASSEALRVWKAKIEASDPVTRQVAHEFPDWLESSFGKEAEIRLERNYLELLFANKYVVSCWFNEKRYVFVTIYDPIEEELAPLRNGLSKPDTLKLRATDWAMQRSSTAYKFNLHTQADYSLLQDVILLRAKQFEIPFIDEAEEELESSVGKVAPIDSVEHWAEILENNYPNVRNFALDYPRWLDQEFGDKVTSDLIPPGWYGGEMFAKVNEKIFQHLIFRRKLASIRVLLYEPTPEDIDYLQKNLFEATALTPKVPSIKNFYSEKGYQLYLHNEKDYNAFKEVTRRMVARLLNLPVTPYDETEDLVDIDEELDTQTEEGKPVDSLEKWLALYENTRASMLFYIKDYPHWLEEEFGQKVSIEYVFKRSWSGNQMRVKIRGKYRQDVIFAGKNNYFYVLINDPASEDIEYIRGILSKPASLREKVPYIKNTPGEKGFRMYLQTPEDYAALKEVTRRMVAREYPTGVTLNKAALEDLIKLFKDRYGTFESEEYIKDERGSKHSAVKYLAEKLDQAELKKLIDTNDFEEGKNRIKRVANITNMLNQFDKMPLLNAPARGLINNFYDLLYGPDPFQKRFTRWVAFLSDIVSKTGKVKSGKWPLATYFLMLHQPQEYIFVKPTPYDEFLEATESNIQRQRPIIPTADFYEKLLKLGKQLLPELEPLGARDMIDVQSFIWVITYEEEKVAEPTDNEIDVTPPDEIDIPVGTEFVRIHFPPDKWDSALKYGAIGIGFEGRPNNISVQRLKKLKLGDRVVVYLRNGVIGSVGIVTKTYYEAEGAQLNYFGPHYFQHIGVYWSEEMPDPIDILLKLQIAENKPLYNKLVNPHTVVPLLIDDYRTILILLNIHDVVLPTVDSQLPDAWEKLVDFLDFAQTLDGAGEITTAELLTRAKSFNRGFNDNIEDLSLAEQLRQFRLFKASGEQTFTTQPYLTGDKNSLLQLMALALLLPTDIGYALPAERILPRLQRAESLPFDQFAPELGSDNQKMLNWYTEGGLVEQDEKAKAWICRPEMLQPLSGDDAASLAYNNFLTALKERVAGIAPSKLEAVGGPLKRVPDLQERIKLLSKDILVESQVIERIYSSLVSGRHVVLSGPPGTGKTELAKRIPSLLWGEESSEITYSLTFELDDPPTKSQREMRHGYAVNIVTATEDWGVRDVVGGIGPRLDNESGQGKIVYEMKFGHLTRTVLQNYAATDKGNNLPPDSRKPLREEYQDENKARYRGVWLVIDEFTRAQVDAAFGSLLTTLGGGGDAFLAVPDGEKEVPLKLPQDFRIIGTLNSFDRHFLNQISEAIKRRFNFVDVLPPPTKFEKYEQGIAINNTLKKLLNNNFEEIKVNLDGTYKLDGLLEMVLEDDSEGISRPVLATTTNVEAAEVLESFWNIFSAIRVFRQLGTAQAEAVYTNLFVNAMEFKNWAKALDSALSDTLADQLQVLAQEELQVLGLYLKHDLAKRDEFGTEVTKLLKNLSQGRQLSMLLSLHDAHQPSDGPNPINTKEDSFKDLSTDQLSGVFNLRKAIKLPPLTESVFYKRLKNLMMERGL